MMITINKGLLKNTLIYTVTDAIGKSVAFLLLPVVSNYLSPDGLGLATNFSVLSSAITLLAGVAIVNSLTYLYYERTKDDNRKLVSNLVIFSFLVCCVLLCLIFLLSDKIYAYTQLNKTFQFCSVGFVISYIFSNLNLQLYRLENKPKHFAIFQITQIILHCILVVLFVIILKQEGEGKIIAEIITTVTIGVIHFAMLIKRGYLCLVFDSQCMKELLKFGLPLMPHSISFWLKSGSDKIFITNFVGLAGNGIYSMALSISTMYTMVSTAFLNAYEPALQRMLKNMDCDNELSEKIKLVKLQYSLYGLFFIVSLLAIIGAWILIHFFVSSKYQESFNYIPGIILASYIYAVYNFSTQFIYTKKKTIGLGIITFTGSIIQMLLSYFLIKNIGLVGAVVSAIVGSSIISFSIFFYSNRVFPLPWFYFLEKNKQRK